MSLPTIRATQAVREPLRECVNIVKGGKERVKTGALERRQLRFDQVNEKDGKNVEIERSLQVMHGAVTALKNESNVNDVKREIGTSFIPPRFTYFNDENEGFMDFVAAPIEVKELRTRAEHYEEQTRDLRSDMRTIQQK